MPQRGTYTPSKRLRSLLWLVAIGTLLFIVLRWNTPIPVVEPLPGTYQYFTEKDFLSDTHRFGGVSHVDSRFVPARQLEPDEVRVALDDLLQSFAATMKDLKVETWLSHGALLGWWWNGKLLPWDTDLDFQMTAAGIAKLASTANLTEYAHKGRHSQQTRKYLLDINPHYSITSSRDVANKIDGRWIDTMSGKFIDITAVHEESPGMLFCKDGHRYQNKEVHPLQWSSLQGTDVLVPALSKRILQDEYGKTSLTNDRFHWYRFNHKTKEWEPE